MSRIVRRKGMDGMQRDGFLPVDKLPERHYMAERGSAERDIGGIMAGF